MYLSAVEINCSQDWMMVYVSPNAQDRNNPYIFSDELILGQGCPATKIHTYQYDFMYPVSDCGIRTKVRMLLSVTLLRVLSCYVLPADTTVFSSTVSLILLILIQPSGSPTYPSLTVWSIDCPEPWSTDMNRF